MALIGAPAVSAAGANSDSRLKEVERALQKEREQSRANQQKAEALDKELWNLRRQLVSAARKTQEHEAKVSKTEDRLDDLAQRMARKHKELDGRREQFVSVLMALERLARHPPEALIAEPLDTASTVRSAILLRTAVPEIEARSNALRAELAELTSLRRQAKRTRQELAAATAGLKRESVRLDELIGKKAALKSRADANSRAAAKRVEKLANEAKDLRDLMARLEEQRKAREKAAREEAERKAAERKKAEEAAKVANLSPPPAKPEPPLGIGIGIGSGSEAVPITKARGRLPYPAAGRVVGLYGQTSETGLARKGILIETRDGARVIAPYDGLVVYAGKFRGYGQILILEHGEGYHTLLAGLSRIDAEIGQWLAAGEPVGLMESPDRDAPVLYVELRRNGQPINPLPWLASQKDKVSG
jgi:septal ring factor EnvC (AmiA/AmiB activator)